MKKWLIAFGIAFASLVLFLLISIPIVPKLQENSRQQMAEKYPINTDTLYMEINKVRAANSLPQFERNPLLDKSAALKCEDMQKDNYYDHYHPKTKKQGLEFIDERTTPYEYASENLNAGVFYIPSDVITSWMGSPTHAASILDPQFTQIGFAICEVASYPGQTVVVQHKINPL